MTEDPVAQDGEFHGVLFTRLCDYIEQAETPFERPVAEKRVASGYVDVYVPSPSNGDLVIEVTRDDVYPRDRAVVRQARDYARRSGTDCFVTCNSNDLFFYRHTEEDDVTELEFVYFDLRQRQLTEAIADLLSAVEHVHERGELPSQRERDRIVGVLRSFHSSIWPRYTALLTAKHGRNERVTRAFDEWVRANDYLGLSGEERRAVAAKQYAYLLTTRVLFYEVVRKRTRAEDDPDAGGMVTPIGTERGFPLDPLSDTTTRNLSSHLYQQFQAIVAEVDQRPVFEDRADLFAVFPENRTVLRKLEEFVATIESERVTELHEDVLGEVYEQLIPADERRELGQFYTHPRIAETLSEWAIARPDETTGKPAETRPRVLDPACGSGTFAVESYTVLENWYGEGGHQEIIDGLVAIDVNRFPLHLTALNLSSRNVHEATDTLHVFHDSFFSIDPRTKRPVDTKPDASEGAIEEIGYFDAVVGNPPYIRQGNLHPDKEHFRSHLSAFGPEGYTTYLDGTKSISGKSDAYVYFITHSTQFLRDGGRLGFIVPNKWLTTRYGETLQRFLFDHYRIEGIVGFTARAFEDALVDTVLLMLERCENDEKREETTVPFVRIREPMDAEDIIETVAVDYPIPADTYMQIRDRPAYRVTAVEQSSLMERGPGKLLPYIRAPSEFIELLEHPRLVPLDGDIGDITRGTMTGANAFFFVSEDEKRSWGIEERFLHPAIKSIGDVDSRVVHAEDTNKYLLDVHDYVIQVTRERGGPAPDSDSVTRVKNALERDGYSGVRSYIDWGEREGHHTGRTCENRAVWFDLGKLEPPEILHPKFFNDRVYTIANPDRLMPSNAIDCVTLDGTVNSDAMAAFFNSTVYKALLETWGRAEGGGALQLMTYEVSSVPVLDVRTLGEEVQEQLARATHDLRRGDESAQDAIDTVVLEVLGLDVSVERFRELYEAMVRRRINGGKHAERPVDDIEAFDGEVTRTVSHGEDDSASSSDDA